MPNIQIVPVENAAQMDIFINLPYAIHSQSSLWVPPLKNQERLLLDKAKHPFWEKAEGQAFLAMKEEAPVGRILAIDDHNYNSYANDNCGAFGFFECYNEQEIANALFTATKNWHAERGLTYMRGPLNPSTNYTCGMLVEGFNLPPSIMMPWNPEYYPQLLEHYNMRKEQDLFAYLFERDKMNLPDWLFEEIKVVKMRKEFTVRTASKETLLKDIEILLEIYKESWNKNWGFTPMSIAEAKALVDELKSVIDPNFFALFYHGDEAVASMVAIPNMNPLLKRLNGNIGISAPWHWLKTKNQLRSDYRPLLLGIKEQFRMMGLPLLILDFLFDQAKTHPHLQRMEGSWSLEDNVLINDLIEDFSGTLYKRYRIYHKEI